MDIPHGTVIPSQRDVAIPLRCGRRGIYTNKLGYLGGINCNLLCAFVCQADPNAKPCATAPLRHCALGHAVVQWRKHACHPLRNNQTQMLMSRADQKGSATLKLAWLL